MYIFRTCIVVLVAEDSRHTREQLPTGVDPTARLANGFLLESTPHLRFASNLRLRVDLVYGRGT